MSGAELVFLGTGHAHVTACFNTCFAYLDGSGSCFLTDAGGGNQILTNLKKADIDIGNIETLFVSHTHTDHILGAVWVIRLFASGRIHGEISGRLTVYGNKDVIGGLNTLCSMLIQRPYSDEIGRSIILEEVKDGDVRTVMGREVRFFDAKSVTAYVFGYEMFYSNERRLVFTGDEPYRLSLEDGPLRDADWAILEATVPYVWDEDIAGHATIKSSSEMAESAGVKNLILSHTEDRIIKTRKEEYLAEAKKYYSWNVFVPDDMDRIKL